MSATIDLLRAVEKIVPNGEIAENFTVLFTHTVREPMDQTAAGGTRPMLGLGPELIQVFEDLGQSRAKAEKLAQLIVDLAAEIRFDRIEKRLDKIEEQLSRIEKALDVAGQEPRE